MDNNQKRSFNPVYLYHHPSAAAALSSWPTLHHSSNEFYDFGLHIMKKGPGVWLKHQWLVTLLGLLPFFTWNRSIFSTSLDNKIPVVKKMCSSATFCSPKTNAALSSRSHEKVKEGFFSKDRGWCFWLLHFHLKIQQKYARNPLYLQLNWP